MENQRGRSSFPHVTITADDQSMTYSGSLPTFTATPAGLVNNDTFDSTTVSYSASGDSTSNVGNAYTITPSAWSSAAAGNYNITYVNGNLTIIQANLTITADDQSMIYGGSLPTFTATATGLVNNDTFDSSDVTFSTIASPSSDIGTYPITPSAWSSAAAGNYNITYANGTLTINPAIFYWIYYGSGIGDGTDPENWSPDQVPGANDVIIYPSGTGNCDMTGFGDGFTVAGCTTLVGYSTMIMLPTDFNVGASGLQMNSGSIQVDASAFLRGASTWTGGNLLSSSPTAANLDLLANFLVPAPESNPTQVKVPLTNETNFIVENNEIATVDATLDDVNIQFAKNAGVSVQTGGTFAFTGSKSIVLSEIGADGSFVNNGDCTINMAGDGVVSMYLPYQQAGNSPRTTIKSGLLLLQGEGANGYAAEINSGTLEIYGNAGISVQIAIGSDKGLLINEGAFLIVRNSAVTAPAVITGNVWVAGGGEISFDGNTNGYGYLEITGNLEVVGMISVTIDFTTFPTCDTIDVDGKATFDQITSVLNVDFQGSFVVNETLDAVEADNGVVNTFWWGRLPLGVTVNYTPTTVELQDLRGWHAIPNCL